MEVDVAVVGGGPAGCSTAITLLSKGYSVAVIASTRHIERPTETAPPSLKQLLRPIHAEEALSACEPCFGICSNWGRDFHSIQPSVVDPQGHAWFIHRARFDRSLRDITCRAGAAWISAHVLEALFRADGVSLATTDVSVRARWLILASGSPHSSARFTREEALQIDSMIGYWASVDMPLKERLLSVESAEYGWWYSCPNDANGTVICLVTDVRSSRLHRISQVAAWNKLFQATALAARLGHQSASAAIRSLPIGLTTLPLRYASRWVAVGDAAMRLDPLGSSGTTIALDSGRRAGLAIDEAMQAHEPVRLKRYARWSTCLFEDFMRQRDRQYAREHLRRTGAFWARRRA